MRAAPAPSFEHMSRFTSRGADCSTVADGKIRFQPSCWDRARGCGTKEDYDKQREQRAAAHRHGVCLGETEGFR